MAFLAYKCRYLSAAEEWNNLILFVCLDAQQWTRWRRKVEWAMQGSWRWLLLTPISLQRARCYCLVYLRGMSQSPSWVTPRWSAPPLLPPRSLGFWTAQVSKFYFRCYKRLKTLLEAVDKKNNPHFPVQWQESCWQTGAITLGQSRVPNLKKRTTKSLNYSYTAPVLYLYFFQPNHSSVKGKLAGVLDGHFSLNLLSVQ